MKKIIVLFLLLSIPCFAGQTNNPTSATSITGAFLGATIASPTLGTGTVSNGAGGTTVTGVGTNFLTTFAVGDSITIPSSGGNAVTTQQTVLISAVTDNTHLTTAAITNANSNVTYDPVAITAIGQTYSTPLFISGTFGNFLQGSIVNYSTAPCAQAGWNAQVGSSSSDITGFAFMGVNNSAFNCATAYNIGHGGDISFGGLSTGKDVYLWNGDANGNVYISTGGTADANKRVTIDKSGNVTLAVPLAVASGGTGQSAFASTAPEFITISSSGVMTGSFAGSSLSQWNSYAGQFEVSAGTAGSPISVAGPTVKISRTDNELLANCANKNDNECNAALAVYSSGLSTATVQEAAISAYAKNASTATGNDAVGLMGSGRITGSGVGKGTGAYLEGRRDTSTGTIVGAEIRADNNGNFSCSYSSSAPNPCVGLYLSAAGDGSDTTLLSSGIQFLNADAKTFFNSGITFSTTTIGTSGQAIDDESAGAYGLYEGGTHATAGIYLGANAGAINTLAAAAYQINGVNALSNPLDSTAGNSVAVGKQALNTQTAAGSAAYKNVAVGAFSMGTGTMTTAAIGNTAIGYSSLTAVTSGSYNSAIGQYALNMLTSGSGNNAMGQGSLSHEVSSANNTGVGVNAGQLATGASGTFIGYNAGGAVTSGAGNTIIGAQVGSTTLTTGANNILIGTSSATDALTSSTSNEINIAGLVFYNYNSIAAPAVSSCGTSPSIDAKANNQSGTVTVGTATATCTITFAGTGYASWNHCRVTPHSTTAVFAYSYTTTAITVTATALGSVLVDYSCNGV